MLNQTKFIYLITIMPLAACEALNASDETILLNLPIP